MAYDLLDLQTAVKDDLKDPSFSASRITRYLNAGQRAIFNTHFFRFCEKIVSGSLTVGEYTYNQQTDHQQTIGGVLVDPDDSNVRVELDKYNFLTSIDFFDQYPDPATLDNNRPGCWTEFGNQIYFSCPVDKAYVFTQRYYRAPTELNDTNTTPDVPETFRELLETYALYRAEKYRGNHDVAATYKQDFEDGLEAMNIRYASTTLTTFPKTRGVRRRASW